MTFIIYFSDHVEKYSAANSGSKHLICSNRFNHIDLAKEYGTYTPEKASLRGFPALFAGWK
ncbi:hypothetical protein [Aestuariispira insulae]|uniref:hypothetical protein n=1 Tax=Aestuariispira insulae TaxID=1461337 RepID=UPI0011C07556|nr:hypothetical protein [Aestuariispira insulae]